MDYIYDGTFDGLLNCFYAHYYQEKATGIYTGENYQCNIIQPCQAIETDTEKAEKVYQSILRKISPLALEQSYNVYLSCFPEKEIKLLHYIVMGLKLGAAVDDWLSHPVVNTVQNMSRKVEREKHKYLGALRFVEVGAYLYAAYEPDHNLLPKMGAHFADRLKNERFIIHDMRRNLALAYQNGETIITDFTLREELIYSEREQDFQRLWKNYFDSIAIESRIKPKLQRQNIPLKYRRYMTEFAPPH